MLNFEEGSYTLPQTGEQQHRYFSMNRDGFTLRTIQPTGGNSGLQMVRRHGLERKHRA